MSYTTDRIRKEMVTGRTPKAVTLTITVKGYDNGMVEVNGHPINKAPRFVSVLRIQPSAHRPAPG